MGNWKEWCDVSRLQNELQQALSSLDELNELCEQQMNSLKEENCELKHNLKQMKMKNVQQTKISNDLQETTGCLHKEIMDLRAEKSTVEEDLKQRSEENVILQELLAKLSNDYEEVKSMYNRQQGPREDKIKALRNTARALENENSLLIKERENLEEDVILQRDAMRNLEERLDVSEQIAEDLRNELNAKDLERSHFMERFQRLESEKMNVMGQISSLHQELDVCKTNLMKLEEEKNCWNQERSHNSDVVQVLREGKRKVEQKLQNVMADNAGLSEQVQVSETRAVSLEEAVRELEQQRQSSDRTVNQMEQQLAETTSLYEARMDGMQQELGMRLEEINENKDSEMRQVKERYIRLFNEKAEEHHAAKEELKVAKGKIQDLEYREEELNSLLNRTRASMEDQFKEKSRQVEQEMEAIRIHTVEVEDELSSLQGQYREVKESYRNSVDMLGRRLYDISDLLQEYQRMEEKMKLNNDTKNEEAQSSHPQSKVENVLAPNHTKKSRKARKKKSNNHHKVLS